MGAREVSMVINVRGTSGSGKSTIVRGIMEKGIVVPIGAEKRPDGYIVQILGRERNLYVVGPYLTACGGCDAIATQDEICDRIRAYATLGDVLLEGLLMANIFGRYAAIDRELNEKGVHCIWGFLDTPLEVCIERVKGRRAERGKNLNEFNPENTTRKHVDTVDAYQKFLRGDAKTWKLTAKYGYTGPPVKLDARMIDHTRAVEQVFEWLSDKQ
jgi:cytidylate kinase